jgi:ATP-dependent protease ClpP protease subunit
MTDPISLEASTCPFRMSLEDRLRDQAMARRTIFIDGEIEPSLVCIVCLQLEAMRGSDKPLRIVINSRGGEVAGGAQIIASVRDLMREGVEVTAEVRGDADSMAAIIACSCSRIEMSRLSRLMLHGVAGMTWGDVQDHEAERQELDRITDELVEIVFTKIKNPTSRFADRKFLRQILRDKRPTWIGPAEAVEAGIADSLLN